MKLNEAGELRVRGYLFVLHRSLATFMSREMAQDFVREVESHILERVARIEGSADEKAALEGVLQHLGPPMKVAQAYAAEITFEDGVTREVPLVCRIDTLAEIEYYRNGGILHTVLRNLVK